MPAPVLNELPSGGGMAVPVPVPGAGPPPDLQAMLGQAPIGLLAGSQLPNQPVTAGLSSGPGVGPEGFAGQSRTPLARTLNQLAERTGDPVFARLARKAGL